MLRSKIKCHSIGNKYEKPHFFILSKGRNAGKPMVEYCANCYVFVADSEEEKWHYYNLCFALWQGRYFIPLLVGSVIEFIRIDELAISIHHANITISQDLETYKEYLDYLKQLNQQRLYLKQQIALIHQVGQALSYKIFKSKKAAH